jgi:predicted dehydrogenase
MTSSASLRVGVIGLGVGEQHIEGYARHPDAEVVVLCDIDPAKAVMARERYPHIRFTDDAHSVLTDPAIDVVSIATYDDVHYAQVVTALAHDKHVFVEKPLCQEFAHAAHIRQLLRERPHLLLSSNLILRQSARFLGVKELCDKGAFGDLFYVETDYNSGRLHKITHGWRGSIEGYSLVYGGGVHVVDLLLWLTGDTVEEVSAYGNAITSRGSGFQNNDMVVSILKFRSGMVGKVSVNFGCVFPHFHPLSLYGTDATFTHTPARGLLYTSRTRDVHPQKIATPYPGVDKYALIPNFIDAILRRASLLVTADDVFATMAVCFAIEQAHREGHTQPVRSL